MRILLALLLAALALVAPAHARELGWSRYDNARFGYAAGIPPRFSGYGESDNGDGQIFDDSAKGQVLSFWGSILAEESFEGAVKARIGYAERDGWNIAAQTVTPRWANFSGVLGQRMFNARMILLCDGESYAVMTVQYSVIHAGEMQDRLPQLEDTFRAKGC
ncbi:hypothetical protein [Devosia geojensis]|uniref:hypothetical protein n=1 Tax=Devosia geojensis TaxID=443610 RepID=UPI0006975B27|nr:hypothetical protein [Devosia geojensis]